jgi:hypothetical protein
MKERVKAFAAISAGRESHPDYSLWASGNVVSSFH